MQGTQLGSARNEVNIQAARRVDWTVLNLLTWAPEHPNRPSAGRSRACLALKGEKKKRFGVYLSIEQLVAD
jgi:hypothetical protein